MLSPAHTMPYEVYARQSIIENLPLRIQSIHCHGCRIWVGTLEGCLLVYNIDDEPSFAISLVQSRKNFVKKAIDLITVLADTLIILSDSTVYQYSATSLEPKVGLPATRGAHLLAAFSPPQPPPLLPGQPPPSTSIIPKLVVASKKRLSLYHCTNDGGIPTSSSQEWTLPDKPRLLNWLDHQRLFAIVNKTILIINTTTNELRPLYEGSYARLPLARIAKPGMLLHPSTGRFLVTCDRSTVAVEPGGHILADRDIEWPEPPDTVLALPPYLVGLVNTHVLVMSIRTRAVVQRIKVPGGRCIDFNSINSINSMDAFANIVYVASINTVWRLLPLDFDDQIEVLISAKKFNEAQALIEELDFPTQEQKLSNIIRVKSLLAHHMFTDLGRYEEAVALLQGLEASPIDVINLYPDIVPAVLVNSENAADGVDPSVQDDELDAPPLPSEKKALLVLKDYLTNQRGVLAKIWRLQQFQPNLDQTAMLSNASSSVSQGRGSTWSNFGPSHVPLGNLNPSQTQPPQNGASDITTADLLYLSEIVDTALLKVYLRVNDALVGPLLRVDNRVNLEEAEQLLTEAKKYKELLDLYRTRGLHRKALDLLVRQLDESDPETSENLLNYLRRLGGAELDLILEYLPHLLPMQSDNILRMLLDTDNEYGFYIDSVEARRKVLNKLDEISPKMGRAYLEHLVLHLNEPVPELHERLALAYIEQSDQRLIAFLEKSTMYRPLRLLEAIPKQSFFEERVVLYSRLDMHDEAIRICMYDVENYHKAEQYCRRHYDADHSKLKDVFTILFSHYMDLVHQGKIKMEVVLSFLSRCGMYLDVIKTIRLTNPNVKLVDLVGFFEGVWLDLQRKKHEKQVVLNLSESDKSWKSVEVMQYQSRGVTITDDRMCSRCLKRIANSSFGVYPDLKIAHVYCLYTSP
ncbi:hypothetical protein SeLEV6574_g03379 [Synchytrium endobioticum]|uniref:CNH domain-containing protein n=1 Tax=Synchytrium endobioticum TaxID=286115 RepID=A0A507D4A2_9FUNG|nr:hypothetical protein SeLEV6574_g03379 [Synchytrium endobioticum]